MGIQTDDVKDGVKLEGVTKDGPSDKAGLKEGDVIRTIDGKAVANGEKFDDEMRTHKVGDKVTVHYTMTATNIEVKPAKAEKGAKKEASPAASPKK